MRVGEGVANRDFHILKGGMNNYHYSYLKDSNKWIFFAECVGLKH